MSINKFNCFDYYGAISINNCRIDYLKEFFDLDNKKVLETCVGARGDITNYLLSLECDVYGFDARKENIDELINRIPQMKNKLTVINFNDKDSLIQYRNQNFDVVLCFGTLYHLSDPENALDEMVKVADELLLETMITKDGDEDKWYFNQEKDQLNQSIDLIGCKPTVKFLEKELKKRYKKVLIPHIQPNNEEFDNKNGYRKIFYASNK